MSGGVQPFVIEGEFSIYRAAELAAQLQAWIPHALTNDCLVVDLGQVSEMDSAGLQLLLALQQCAATASARFELTAASAPVKEVLRLAALEHWLASDTPPQPSAP
jgi:anti-sigma B factor antagonist